MEGNEKGNEAMSEEAKDHKEPEEAPTIGAVNAGEEEPAPEPEIAGEEQASQGEGEAEEAVEEEPAATGVDDEPHAPEEELEEAPGRGPLPKPSLGKRTKMAIGLVALVAVCGIGAALGVGAGSPAAQPADTSGSAVSAASAQPAAEEPAAGATEEAHHTWEPVYGIVHLEKKTHKEHVDATYKEVTEYETLCNVCKQPVTGKAQEHSEKTGHTGFTTNVPVVKEAVDVPAKDVEVTDQEARDAYALTGYRCDCGKSLTLEEAKETGVYDPADEYDGEDNPETR